MSETIAKIISESIRVKETVRQDHAGRIGEIASLCVASLKKGGTILLCGNGGSAADSQHFAAELVGRFTKERRPFAALALTTNTSTLTALVNDYSGEVIFARQVEALGRPGDVLIAISTSGRSPNVIAAVRKAKEKGMKTVALTGGDGGSLAAMCDEAFIAPSGETPRIQETHLLVIHILCELIENGLTS